MLDIDAVYRFLDKLNNKLKENNEEAFTMRTEEYIERINILTPKIMKSLQFMYPPQIKEMKLSLSQAIVMICLFEKDRMSMGELAREVYLNLSSLTKITDSLIKENLFLQYSVK